MASYKKRKLRPWARNALDYLRLLIILSGIILIGVMLVSASLLIVERFLWPCAIGLSMVTSVVIGTGLLF